jgi:hypothetical protein
VGWNLKEAINKYTPHEAIHITRTLLPFCNKTDFQFTKDNLEQFKILISDCNVLHFNQWIWTYNPFLNSKYL